MALVYWFGVSRPQVTTWREVFGVSGRVKSTPGTERAVSAAIQAARTESKGREYTQTERQERSRRAKRQGLGLGRIRPARPGGQPLWTAEEVALLGTDHDEVIAQKIGRTGIAVASQRRSRKIRAFSGWPGGNRGWSAEEIALLGTDTDARVAARIGRTATALIKKRAALQIPAFRRRRAR